MISIRTEPQTNEKALKINAEILKMDILQLQELFLTVAFCKDILSNRWYSFTSYNFWANTCLSDNGEKTRKGVLHENKTKQKKCDFNGYVWLTFFFSK